MIALLLPLAYTALSQLYLCVNYPDVSFLQNCLLAYTKLPRLFVNLNFCLI